VSQIVLTAPGVVRAQVIANTDNTCSGDFGLQSPSTIPILTNYDAIPKLTVADVGTYAAGQELVFYLDVSATWCGTPLELSTTSASAHVYELGPNLWEIDWEDSSDGDYNDLIVRVGLFSCDEVCPQDNAGQVIQGNPAPISYGPDGTYDRWGVLDGSQLHTYRAQSSGPIDASIKIGKYLGPVDAGGHPLPGHALYGASVPLVIAAYDVDSQCSTAPCEQDEVLVNGTSVGYLHGSNNAWSTVNLSVPTSSLRFRASYLDQAGGVNDIQFLVDGLSTVDRWFVIIWDANLILPPAPEKYRPTVLLHGLASTNGPGPDNGMSALKSTLVDDAPSGFDPAAVMNPDQTDLGSIEQDLDIVVPQIEALRTESGWDRVNIVGHSMGGLVGRAFASMRPNEVKRVITLGTPNGGVGAADDACALTFLLGLIEPGSDLCQRNPALLDIREAYVQGFDEALPDSPDARYLAVAGDHGGSCIWILPTVPYYLFTPSDGCVAVWSAQYMVKGHEGNGSEDTVDPQPLTHAELPINRPLAETIKRLLLGLDPWPESPPLGMALGLQQTTPEPPAVAFVDAGVRAFRPTALPTFPLRSRAPRPPTSTF
jgi:pimeloyl-ACP methyl ester carboxylesterase